MEKSAESDIEESERIDEVAMLRTRLEELEGIVKKKPKQKRNVGERSQKQNDAFQKALEVRKQNIEKRKTMREKAEEEAKKMLEEKIVKKAIAVKRREIKKLQILEPEPEDDSEEEEEYVEKPKARPSQAPPPQPKQAAVEKPQVTFRFF